MAGHGMPDPEWLDRLDPEEARRLTWNGSRVQALQNALAQLKSRADTVPDLVEEVIQEGCWLRWVDSRNRPFSHSKAEFRRFIESPRDEGGCDTPLHRLLEVVKGTPSIDVVNEALRGTQGGDNNPFGRSGKPEPEINRDIITVDFPADSEPQILPIKPRDYSREAPTGTSVSYALRRLGKARPDLLDRIRSGELSPGKAMVEAGFKLRSITVDDDPERAGRRLLRHFRGDRLEALIRILSEGLRAE